MLSSPTRALGMVSDKFVERQVQILALSEWCEFTVKSTRADPSGPAAQATNLKWLVRGIEGVLERHKNQRLRRTKLIISFVEEVCRIAAPGVGGSSIDEAMKSVISERRSSANPAAAE